MAEKRVEIEINGKVFKVPEHLVEDMQLFGASLTKRTIKAPPPELLNIKPKAVILPKEDTAEAPTELNVKSKAVILPDKEVKKPVTRKRK